MAAVYATGKKAGLPKPNRAHRICVDCGASIDRLATRCKACYERTRPHQHNRDRHACRGCGDMFTPKHTGNKGLYCSRECAFANKDQWLAPRLVLTPERKKHKLAAIERSKAYQRKLLEKPGLHQRVWFRECDKCRKPYVATRSNQRHCSTECSKHELLPIEARHCASCGGEFISSRPSKLYCSDRCRPDRGLRKFKQRALHYGVFYEPVNEILVFYRDGWKCQICGKSTPQQQRGKHRSNSPEIDHRVPMSKGGPHSYANTQCACRACNVAKGNKTERGQMSLFIRGMGGIESLALMPRPGPRPAIQF